MIPVFNGNTEVETTEYPTYTYGLDLATNRIVGFVDGLQAMAQSNELILNTQRYQYLIYSWNYGVELADLIGQNQNFVQATLQRRITESLLVDNRNTAVFDFKFTPNGNELLCVFKVTTIYGETESEVVL